MFWSSLGMVPADLFFFVFLVFPWVFAHLLRNIVPADLFFLVFPWVFAQARPRTQGAQAEKLRFASAKRAARKMLTWRRRERVPNPPGTAASETFVYQFKHLA